jgi:outer membrane protein assembly factor BamA
VIDPTIGNGLAGVAMYAVRLDAKDKASPPSVFGGGGFYTSSKSWGLGGGAKLYLKQDRFRILAAGVTARANYDYYGVGSETDGAGLRIPITQKGGGLIVGAQVRVFERFFVGSRYYYFKVNTGLGNTSSEIPEAIKEVQIKLPVAALGLHLERETRDSQFYPRSGSIFDTKIYFSDKNVGALFTYQDYEISFQQYFGFGKRQVLAYRVKVCAVNGHAPFFALCSIGNSADLRGYPMGRFRDRRMLVGQAEYRREIWWRFGVTAFAGAGQVAPTFSGFNGSSTRPGGGVGLRFALAPKNHINLRVDFSVGQGSHAWYVGIGEAF